MAQTLTCRQVWMGAVALTLLTWGVGFVTLGRINTDVGSEAQAYQDALSIAQGSHHVGIVTYAHYPNGPSYLLLPFIKLGVVDANRLRLIPITISALAFGFLGFALLRRTTQPVWAVLLCLGILSQPGFFAWQGCLHEHSYNLSVVWVLIGFALTLPLNEGRWLFAVTGFFAGWIGYDFVFVQTFSVLAMRWLVYLSATEENSLQDALIATLLDGFSYFSGFVLAVDLHLLQLRFFYGSFAKATADFIGVAFVRLGMDPLHSHNVRQSRPMLRLVLPCTLFVQFLYSFARGGTILHSAKLNDFSNRWTLAPLLIASLALLYQSNRAATRAYRDQSAIIRHRWILGIAFGFILWGAIGWAMVMPEHCYDHQYFLPRQYIVPTALIGLMSAAFGDRLRSSEKSRQEWRHQITAMAIFALPILLLAYFLFTGKK